MWKKNSDENNYRQRSKADISCTTEHRLKQIYIKCDNQNSQFQQCSMVVYHASTTTSQKLNKLSNEIFLFKKHHFQRQNIFNRLNPIKFTITLLNC